MNICTIFLLLSALVTAVLSASIPSVDKSALIEDAYSDESIRVPRSPKKGGIYLKIEKEGPNTSINVEGKQTLWEGKYGKVDVGGAIVKTPNEETKGRLELEAKFEWKK